MTPYKMPNYGGKTISTKISIQLIRELREGDFSQEISLPSEMELAGRYGVSRSVIRDALADLEREGLVERMRGIGTVIHRDIVNLNNRLDLKYEYNELIRGSGCRPSTDSIQLRVEHADDELADKLQINLGDRVIVCEKRLLAGGKPVIYSIDRLPLSLLGDVCYTSIDWSTPIFDILEQYSGITVDTDIAKITATNASLFIREKLQVEDGESLILIDEIGYYKLTQPILQTFGFYTNFFGFTMLRKKF